MTNFFLKIRKLESGFGNLFRSVASAVPSHYTWEGLSELCCFHCCMFQRRKECTIAKPSNTHLHRSVKRVMFFNGIFLSHTGVTYCADFPELENWQRMAGSAQEHLLEESLCRNCMLPLSLYFPSGRCSWLGIWINRSQIKKWIVKTQGFFFLYGNTYRPQSTLWPFVLSIVHLNWVCAVKLKMTRAGPAILHQLLAPSLKQFCSMSFFSFPDNAQRWFK